MGFSIAASVRERVSLRCFGSCFTAQRASPAVKGSRNTSACADTGKFGAGGDMGERTPGTVFLITKCDKELVLRKRE